MSGARILVVDDEGPTRDFIVEGLNALGITDNALGVASAEDALAAAAEQPPEVVISDIRMTGLNGLDLARYLHQNHPDTKVILVTGYSTRDIERTASALAVDALLRKPFGLDALGEAVRAALRRSHSAGNGSGLSPAKTELVMRQIEILKRDVGAQWIGLLDHEGNIVLTDGLAENMDEPLTQIVSQGWAKMMTLISGQIGACFLYVEGQPHDIYLSSVDNRYCLTFIYDRRWQTNRIGAVWLTAKHSVEEIARLLSNQAADSLSQTYIMPGRLRHLSSVEP
jgi:CheY-like chemotaxis protein/predicted regulator of Ras-like GTPase activity (Roadblock/LC7/MglB family)